MGGTLIEDRERLKPILQGSIVSAYPKARLFLVSSLALTMAGVGAALRANTASDLQRIFLDPIDKVHSGEMIANVLGLPFFGFALTITRSAARCSTTSAWACCCRCQESVSRLAH